MSIPVGMSMFMGKSVNYSRFTCKVQLRHFAAKKISNLNSYFMYLVKKKADPHEIVKCFHDIKQKGLGYNARIYLLAQTSQIRIHCQNRDVYAAINVWNNMINNDKYKDSIDEGDCCWVMLSFLKNKMGKQSLNIFHQILELNIKPRESSEISKGIYHIAISAATQLKSPKNAENIYCILKEKQPHLLKERFILNNLVNMFLQCGDMDNAIEIFNKKEIDKQNIAIWTILLNGMIKDHKYQNALDLYYKMISENIKPDIVMYSTILKAVSSLKYIDKLNEIYQTICEDPDINIYQDSVFVTAMIAAFSRCGEIKQAIKMWDDLLLQTKNPNIITTKTFNAMMNLYSQNTNDYKKILELYDMLIKFRNNADINTQHIYNPNLATYIVCFDACSKLKDLKYAKMIHYDIMETFSENQHKQLHDGLIKLYIECVNNLNEAIEIWKNITDNCNNWGYSFMINTYIDNGDNLSAFRLFDEMQNMYNIKPDITTFKSIIRACDQKQIIDEMYEYIKSFGDKFINNKKIIDSFMSAYAMTGDNDKYPMSMDKSLDLLV